MMKAKTFLLSKDKQNSAYPEEGNIRVISVLPAITKLLETVILDKINGELNKPNNINPASPKNIQL